MKKLFLLPLVLLAAACSNEDEPSNLPSGDTEVTKGISSFTKISDLYQPVHSDLLGTLLSGTEAMTYSRSGWELYRCPDNNPKYDYLDMTGWYGFSSNMPQEIIFSDGHVWAPYSTFSLTFGPSKFGMAWDAYKKVTGVTASLYVGHDFRYDESDRKVTFLGREFDMLLFNRNSFVMAENFPLLASDSDGNRVVVGDGFEITAYERTADVAMLDPGAIGFNSNAEVMAYIIDKCREQFGEVINLNVVYAPNVIFDDPYIYIENLEKLAESGYHCGAY